MGLIGSRLNKYHVFFLYHDLGKTVKLTEIRETMQTLISGMKLRHFALVYHPVSTPLHSV